MKKTIGTIVGLIVLGVVLLPPTNSTLQADIGLEDDYGWATVSEADVFATCPAVTTELAREYMGFPFSYWKTGCGLDTEINPLFLIVNLALGGLALWLAYLFSEWAGRKFNLRNYPLN
jgi:hypothetical protein